MNIPWPIARGTRYDAAYRVGPADVRPCGCVNDPGVFGHSCCPECGGAGALHGSKCSTLAMKTAQKWAPTWNPDTHR